jgi:SAM-dependent methyltransferase
VTHPGSGARDALRDEIVRLGPWHFDIEVTPEIGTSVSLEASYPESFGPVAFQDVRRQFKRRMEAIYPGGLEGRSVLDCACNCGAYLFWAKEMGAGECFGSDVREHWIDQARFLLEHRPEPKAGLRFEARDIYELPALDLEPFDITIFTGVFYHLPDPITGLKIAADLTTELLVFDTAIRTGQPDGFLAVEQEAIEPVMSGVYGLNWLPTGPQVMARILEWAGFADIRVTRMIESAHPGVGRLAMLAAKRPGLLEATGATPVSR